MSALTLTINGQSRTFEGLSSPVDLQYIVNSLNLQVDRIAVEHNYQIVARSTWAAVPMTNGDRLEIVHFVGGGTA